MNENIAIACQRWNIQNGKEPLHRLKELKDELINTGKQDTRTRIVVFTMRKETDRFQAELWRSQSSN